MRFLAAGLIVLPLSALALEPGEFHLYGINKAGLVFDMTPYQGGASGDPATARGFTSRFANWVKPGEATLIKPQRICTGRQTPDECLRWALMHPAGRCSVRLAPKYTITCTSGQLPFSDVTYEGEAADEKNVSRVKDADELYRSFLRRHDDADPDLAAVYRCKTGCKDSLPPTLIFLWLGD